MTVELEKTYVAREIENSRDIDDETRFKAINEIETLSRKGYPETKYDPAGDLRKHWFDPTASDIDDMFEWEDSELGVDFWANVQDEVFESKRSC